MSLIAPTKYGDCSTCSATNTNVVKRGKVLLCLSCKRKFDTKKQAAKMKERNEVRKLIIYQREGNPETVALEKWYAKIAERHLTGMGTLCMNCGEWIPQKYIRHATAHLLPKKLFKSVATHELNYLILGASCSCHQQTDRLDKFVKMKVWGEAARRIKTMIPLLPFNELQFLSSQLLNELDKI